MKKTLVLFAVCVLTSLHAYAQWSTVKYEHYYYECYGEVDLKGATFTILPADESIAPDNPKFMWYAQQTAPWVMLRGANYVTSVDEAELVLLLDYGIGETTPRVYNKPIWGRTGVISSTSTVRGNKISTTYTPSYGVTGYQQNMVNQYRKHIEMYLYDANTSNGMTLLWQAAIEMVGASSNLQSMFPAMLYKLGKEGWVGRQHSSGDKQSLFDWDWDSVYNLMLPYATRAIADNYVPWRKLWMPMSDPMTISTYDMQKKKDCYIIPSAIVQTDAFARVYFYVLCPDEPKWKISDLSNLYILLPDGKKYYAKAAQGLKKGKTLSGLRQRTFTVDFEPLPEEMQYGVRYLSIREEKKNKLIQGWVLMLEQ